MTWKDFLVVVSSRDSRNTREQADSVLFLVSLTVEYCLLLALSFRYISETDSILVKVAAGCVTAALFLALAIHQFLIFRNASLQYSAPGTPLGMLELAICLLFGVLTGELGYLIVLAICNFSVTLTAPRLAARLILSLASGPFLLVALIKCIKHRNATQELRQWLVPVFVAGALFIFLWLTPFGWDGFALQSSPQKLTWAWAKEPLLFSRPLEQHNVQSAEFATRSIRWFVEALGCLLEAVFASGAAALSFLILSWDWLSRRSFRPESISGENNDDMVVRKNWYKTVQKFFFGMDTLAFFAWMSVVGVVVPPGGPGPAFVLAILGLLYCFFAICRLYLGKKAIETLSSPELALRTIL